MYGRWTENVVLWRNFFDSFKTYNDVELLSLGAKSTFKIIHLGDYVLRIDFLKIIKYNDDKKCNNNSSSLGTG